MLPAPVKVLQARLSGPLVSPEEDPEFLDCFP